jgi:SAM-dependent methyltransferase
MEWRRRRQHDAWEDWADVDPLWAVLTSDTKRHGQWELDEFFASGRQLVEDVLARAASLRRPEDARIALDFGCGVGRLTVALAAQFKHTIGLDIAAGMVAEAERLDCGASGAVFRLHRGQDLVEVPSASVDFLLCMLVLQHLPSRDAVERYIGEFVRVLSPGGVAVFQLPTYVPAEPPLSLRGRIGLRRRVTRLLRRAGVGARILYQYAGWQPEMNMIGIPRDEVVAVIERVGGVVLNVDPPTTDYGGVESCVYYAAPERPRPSTHIETAPHHSQRNRPVSGGS